MYVDIVLSNAFNLNKHFLFFYFLFFNCVYLRSLRRARRLSPFPLPCEAFISVPFAVRGVYLRSLRRARRLSPFPSPCEAFISVPFAVRDVYLRSLRRARRLSPFPSPCEAFVTLNSCTICNSERTDLRCGFHIWEKHQCTKIHNGKNVLDSSSLHDGMLIPIHNDMNSPSFSRKNLNHFYFILYYAFYLMQCSI